MTQAPAQLVINNIITGEQRSQPLDKSELTIGRNVANGREQADIVLASPRVSAVHALMRRGDGTWTVEHKGVNRTLIEGEVLKPGQRHVFRPGDKMQIGEFILTFGVQTAAAEAGAEAGPQQRVMAFEADIHGKLLDRMDLRRGGQARDMNAPETREKIERHLDELVAEAVAAMPEELMAEVTRMAMYRRLSWRVTAAGSRADATAYDAADAENAVFEAQARRIEDRMIKGLGLSLAAKAMEQDSVLLDSGFAAAFEAHRLDFTYALRKYLVSGFIKRNILDLIFGLGPLQDLMQMDSISEIMVVSKDQIFIEKFGVVEDSRRAFFSDELLLAVIERIVAPVGRRIDQSSPLVDAHLPDGSRVNAVIPPLAVKGPCITIRKFSKDPLSMDDLVRFGALTEEMKLFLKACVESRKNIIVSGGTGSGKTTLLNSLSSFIPVKERIVTIEDTAELQLQQAHVVTLESRPPNMEGKGAVTIRDLVKNALRMRPDRIVVGECRGPEALDMLQAMNTGHDGSMTTAHANSPDDMMLRLETMVLMGTDMPISAIREQIIAAVDVVVQLNRFADGARRVTQIAEVVGIDDETGSIIVEPLFRYKHAIDGDPSRARHINTGYVPSFIGEMLDSGVITLETFLPGKGA